MGESDHPCTLLWAIPSPHPAGALRATEFAPGEFVNGLPLGPAVLENITPPHDDAGA